MSRALSHPFCHSSPLLNLAALLMSLALRSHLVVVREGEIGWCELWCGDGDHWYCAVASEKAIAGEFLGNLRRLGRFPLSPLNAASFLPGYSKTSNGDTSPHPVLCVLSKPGSATPEGIFHQESGCWVSVLEPLWDNNYFLFLSSVLLRKKEISNSCAALLCPLIVAHTGREMISWVFQRVVAHGQWNKRDQPWELQLDLESQLMPSLASCNNPTCAYLNTALFGHRPGALSLGDFADKFRLQDILKFLASRRVMFLNSLPNRKVGARSLAVCRWNLIS